MIETIFSCLVVPLLVIFFHFLYIKKTGNGTTNFILQSLILSVMILLTCVGVGIFTQVADKEIRNGEVISKSHEVVPCSHSYPCNCTKDGCSICYRHVHDYDWVVKTNIPYNFTIARVDEQGNDEPRRWTSVKIGDPVSDSFTYINYIKGAKTSLFNKGFSDIDVKDVPEYPSTYDYYHVDRVIGVGVPVKKEWNQKLQSSLSKMGPRYQVNVIVVITNKPESFNDLLEYKWGGGKKNDVIVVVNINPETNEIGWVNVISWTPEQIFKVELRDDIVAGKTFDFDDVLGKIESHISKNWKRMQMKDFSYLSSDIDIPIGVLVGSIILSIGGYFGMYFYLMNRNFSTIKLSRIRRRFF